MDEPWGRPPWDLGDPIAAVPLPARVDVAVVGAGFAGLAAAWELARRDVSVAVLEAGRIGAGASGRSGAIALEGTAVGELPDAGHLTLELQSAASCGSGPWTLGAGAVAFER